MRKNTFEKSPSLSSKNNFDLRFWLLIYRMWNRKNSHLYQEIDIGIVDEIRGQ